MCVIIQGTTCVDLWHCSHVSRGTIAAVVLSSFFSPHILILIISPFAHRLRLSPLFNSSLFFFAHFASLYYYLDPEFYYLINSSFFPHSSLPLGQLFNANFSLLYAISPFITAGGYQDFHKIYIN